MNIASLFCRTALAAFLILPQLASAQVFTATGSNAAAITPTVTNFRNGLGTLNPNAAGSFGTGRREINWDGVPANFSAPNNLPANFFNVNSPRGVVFSTPGSGFQVSGATTDGGPGQPAAANFGNIDPSYTNTFSTFSPQRLFTPIGSNVVDVTFFVAGSTTPGLTNGFGAVFSDVDLANTTSIQFFDRFGASLGTFFATATAGPQTLSFLGVIFATNVVARVRITNGNFALAPGVLDGNGSAVDVVTMDDFIYGEVQAVPESGPGIVGWLALAGVLLAARLRQRAVAR